MSKAKYDYLIIGAGIIGITIMHELKKRNPNNTEYYLNYFIQNKDFFALKSKENQIWFDKYTGIGLAKEYKKIIEKLYKEKIK